MSDNPTKHHHAKSSLPADPTLPVKAIETMLVDKGLVHPAAIDTMVDGFENQIGPPNELGSSPAAVPTRITVPCCGTMSRRQHWSSVFRDCRTNLRTKITP